MDSNKKKWIHIGGCFVTILLVLVVLYRIVIMKPIEKEKEELQKIQEMQPSVKLDNNNVADLDTLVETELEEDKLELQLSEEINQPGGIDTTSNLSFAGKWKIDKVAVISEWYTGTEKDGWIEEFDSEDFLNIDLEYYDDKILIGDQEFLNPKYEYEIMTVMEFDRAGGRFRVPSLYDCFEENNIEIENDEVTVVVIRFPYEAAYFPYSFIPVGDNIVLLNDEYMLVGTWGKILLAHKISD